ncbi:3'-5' exonuclease [Spirosoma daeguense]
MAWMIREDQLDPDQKDFINIESKKTGNIWVKGYAGSGKSVLLVHSLMDTLQKQPESSVIVLVFTHSLKDMFENGIEELKTYYKITRNIPVKTYYDFVDKDNLNYDYIFCDEVQDLPAKVLYEMKNRSKKIIVAGDSNQSIYQSDPKWFENVVDSEVIGDIINARPYTLNFIHRLTKSIIEVVQKLIPNMNIWSSKRDLTKEDVFVRLCEADNIKDEVNYIYLESQKGANINEKSVVLLPTHTSIISFFQILLEINNCPQWVFKPIGFDINKPKEKQRPDYENLNNHLRKYGLKIQYIGNNQGSFKNAENNKNIIVMTYHSSKGLDFDNVFLPFLNNSLFISPYNRETLFMVAMTRSRKNLYLTYFGYTHDLVDKFKGDCTNISVSDILNQRASNHSTDNFDF